MAAPSAVTRPTAAGTTIECTQAVFTSVKSATADGYHLSAVGTDLTAEERRHVAAHCPSHDGLCCTDPRAVGLAFYRLPTGRLAAGYTCCAGQEHSGRGGLRLYTRTLVFDAARLEQFAHHPLNVFRAMKHAGLTAPDLNLQGSASPVILRPLGDMPESTFARAGEHVGSDWLAAILTQVLNGESLVLSGDFDAVALLETVLISMPAALRVERPFSVGIRYSVGRSFALTLISGDPARAGRLVRGHDVTLWLPKQDTRPPTVSPCRWTTMARDHWRASRWRELATFCALPFSACTHEAYERYAQIRIDTEAAPRADVAALLATARKYAVPTDLEGVERTLVATALRENCAALRRRLATLDLGEAVAHAPALGDIVVASDGAAGWVAPILADLLRRIADQDPLKAAGCAMELPILVPGSPGAKQLAPVTVDIIEAIESWAAHAPAADRSRAAERIEAWRRKVPASSDAAFAERLTALHAALIDPTTSPPDQSTTG